MTELLKNLKMIYGKDRIKPDLWGRRDATPAEIQRVLPPEVRDDLHAITAKDVIKDRRRRARR